MYNSVLATLGMYFLYLCVDFVFMQSDLDDNNPEEEENIVWPWEKEYEHQNKQTPNLSVRNIGKMLTAIFLLWQFIYNISNSAMSTLIKILRVVFLVLSQRSESEWIAALYEAFSTSYNGALKTVGITETHELYVVCPKCNLVYQSKNCVEYQFGQLKSVKCSYVEFPNHPHKQKRAPCGAILCDEKLSINNTIRLIPKKVYPCVSLETELKRLISQPNFLTKCEHWRTHPQFIPPGILADVYEGRMWKFFNSEEGGDYLKYPGNLLFALNFDFFQPFSHTRYSIGALYLTVLNLPRNERYKTENIILVCLIPGPHEPKLTINQYLAPFVQEMKSAYDGYLLSINDINIGLCNVLVRGCIACVTCDVPAVRKLCGFLGHTARLGCSKCLKEFPTQSFGDKPDYSGYDRHLWPPRSLADHKINCDELSKCKSKSALSEAESNYGIRYSLLLDLPMFDPIRFSVIDPMHNLLLGTSKYMFTLWQDTGILTYHHLLNIETLCEKFQFPHDVGRLPLKIGSSFSGFTADQWRIWTAVLSPVALKTALPDAHYKCWLLFVRACTMLCTRIISESTVDGADRFLLLFCRTLESLYGHSACTPNHHLSLHLRECLLDYGPGLWPSS